MMRAYGRLCMSVRKVVPFRGMDVSAVKMGSAGQSPCLLRENASPKNIVGGFG